MFVNIATASHLMYLWMFLFLDNNNVLHNLLLMSVCDLRDSDFHLRCMLSLEFLLLFRISVYHSHKSWALLVRVVLVLRPSNAHESMYATASVRRWCRHCYWVIHARARYMRRIRHKFEWLSAIHWHACRLFFCLIVRVSWWDENGREKI